MRGYLLAGVTEECQEIITGQRASLPLMPLGCLNSNKVIFRNYVNHAETIFGEPVNFCKTHLHASVR